jgi:hypothetical protein
MGFGLVIGFTDHVQVVTINKYNTLADFHTKSSQYAFTSLHSSSEQWLFLCNVFTIHFLAVGFNTGTITVTPQI